MLPAGIIPQAVNSLVLRRMGEINAWNMLRWLKLLLLHLVGFLYYYMNDARSHKHPIFSTYFRKILEDQISWKYVQWNASSVRNYKGRTDIYMTKLIVPLLSPTKAHKNVYDDVLSFEFLFWCGNLNSSILLTVSSWNCQYLRLLIVLFSLFCKCQVE